jgi:type I restriction enzyme S subunit
MTDHVYKNHYKLLNDVVSQDAPICYGILMPGPEVTEGVPVIKVRNFSGRSIAISDVIHTSHEIDRLYKRSKVKSGDILLAIRGTTGDVVIVPDQLDGANITQDTARIRVHDSTDRDYTYFVLKSPAAQSFILLNTIGQAVKGINLGEVRKIPLYWPSQLERQRITKTLLTWGNSIDLTERLIAAKQERRKWLMQQLLTGKRRLPGFDKPWATVHLGNVFTNRIEINRPDLPLIAITGAGGVVSREDLVRRDTSNEDKSKYLRICPGDIGYNTMRMWQGVCGLSEFEGIVSPAYTIVTPKDYVDGEFMALLFKSPSVIHLFHRHSQGLVDDTLNLKWRHFAEIKVAIPENAEQKAIATVFRTADREMDLLLSQLDALREQKKGLMQKLLTGKVRVKV